MLKNSKPTLSVNDAIASIKDWATVEQFSDLFTHIPQKTIRWQLTQRQTNGLAQHVRLIGKQRYISISGYADWLATQSRG